MDYLPEWKIYLWKKLILNKDGEFDGKLTAKSFNFFDGKERELMRAKMQRSIDTINLAVRSKSIENINTKGTDWKNSYFYFNALDLVTALRELHPAILEIHDIRINKEYFKTNPSDSKHFGFGEAVYAKISADQGLTLKELGYHIYPDMYHYNELIDHLTFNITINKKKLRAKLVTYLNDFGKNKLVGLYGIRYIDPKRQQSDILNAIYKLSAEYGKNLTITADEVAKAGGWYMKDESRYRFYEAIFSLEKAGYFDSTDLRKEEVRISLKDTPSKEKVPEIFTLIQTPEIAPRITIGKLIGYHDGSIRYDGKVLNLRPQIKDLCWLFMQRKNTLVNATDIKEEIVKASKRKATSEDTISKYVSELHNELQIHFGRRVITNEPKGGWIFNP